MTVFITQLAYRRRSTRRVFVGEVGVGGDDPIRIQSMLTSATSDLEGVIAEMRGLVEAGCEIIRLTVPNQKDLAALHPIRERMSSEGLAVPLVADIHFNPRLALGAVPEMEKIRINPGNYVEPKKIEGREYSEAQFKAELERIEEELKPLVSELTRHGRALRVGVNHGSLGDRIVNRYGDTPLGMVESALEYLRALSRQGFHDTIVSMKSSNPLVVIQAYRLLAATMEKEGMDYPLHLGVTEAGDGLEGRIKSAVGIGALLCDGLGDTIRVSLTEPAAAEIPAARELVEAITELQSGAAWPETVYQAPIAFTRRSTGPVTLAGVKIGDGAPVGYLALGGTGLVGKADEGGFDGLLPWQQVGGWQGPRLEELPDKTEWGEIPPLALFDAGEIDGKNLETLLERAGDFPGGLLLVVKGNHLLFPLRRLAGLLDSKGLDWPLGVMIPMVKKDAPPLGLAAQVGGLAADGLLDALLCPAGVEANGQDEKEGTVSSKATAEFCRTLLQAARLRTYKTEFISCPSCGRTLFDLQETTARIKARTGHLKGVKIGVMGCIVNGPGEMADADFGYVGGAPDKINLYRGQHCVERGIPAGEAVERLVELIKKQGRWVEP